MSDHRSQAPKAGANIESHVHSLTGTTCFRVNAGTWIQLHEKDAAILGRILTYQTKDRVAVKRARSRVRSS